ncbi:MAG: endo alpha-1,4 polygalactosaminidase [Acidobacteriia bacterium]|nr:endo alpha-1,4 polygalactosaminidase [Terriglobia bacterium]
MRLVWSIFFAVMGAGPVGAVLPWAVCYSDRPRPEEFSDFRLIVLDSDIHPPLAPLAMRGKELLGYLSLGEIDRHRAYFDSARAEGILLDENPNWPGSFYVDFRNENWQRRVMEQLVPAILHAGFNGVFLDTLDDAAALEQADPTRYRGMAKAAAGLVRSLRTKFPGIRIMVNRGYELLPEIAPSIDVLLGESVYTTYDTAHKGYVRVVEAQYKEQVRLLKQALNRNPRLTVCSLDYWDPADRKGIRRIYQIERANGFAPYVATRELDRVVRAP